MALDERQIRDALAELRYPGFDRDLVSLGVVRDVAIDGGRVTVRLEPGPQGESVAPELRRSVSDRLASVPGVETVHVELAGRGAGSSALPMSGARPSNPAAGGLDRRLAPGVRQIIAVASGKGGVGKSTVAVNLAVALARRGHRIGLLDADIYGPSIPTMTGVQAHPELTPDRRLVPFERHGVRLMSLGLVLDDPDQAIIWRGPMVMKAIEQLLRDVDWGELDVLVVDMPPGTGDAQLTLSQKVDLAGAVIVTTPQDVALADAIKGVAMFRKVDVPLLGLVENMSVFRCPHCEESTPIFGTGGGRREAKRLGVPFLAELPLDPALRTSGDEGTPLAARGDETPSGAAFGELADRVAEALGLDADPSSGTDPASGGPGVLERFRRGWGGRGS